MLRTNGSLVSQSQFFFSFSSVRDHWWTCDVSRFEELGGLLGGRIADEVDVLYLPRGR